MPVNLNLQPTGSQLRQFGLIAFGVFTLLGSVVAWRGGPFGLSFGSATWPVAYALWALGLVSGLLALIWPTANRPLFVLLALVTFPVGFIVSHVVLAVLFFGILTPLGLFFRMTGRDPLDRKWEPARDSYWEDLPETREKKDYFRQF